MCGHVGIIGNLGYKDEQLMKRLLVLDYFRGMDSTGFASVKSFDKSVQIAKIASHPFDLFDCARFTKALAGTSSHVFMGHNRAATKGKVNGANAHPFDCGNIIGAHNGTLDHVAFSDLKRKVGEYDTDSETIFQSIAQFGVEETIRGLRGAWALVWYNIADDAMYFLRNKERPLWYAMSEDFKRMFYTSEWENLRAANDTLSENNQSKFYKSNEGYRFWQFKEDHLYRIPLTDLQRGLDGPRDFIVAEIKGKEPAPVHTYTGGHPFPRDSVTNQVTGKPITTQVADVSFLHQPAGTGTKTTPDSTNSNTSSDVKAIHKHDGKPYLTVLESSNINPYGNLVSEEEFNTMARYGCSYCGTSLDYTDKGVTVYKNIGAILCSECSGFQGEGNKVVIPDEQYEEVI